MSNSYNIYVSYLIIGFVLARALVAFEVEAVAAVQFVVLLLAPAGRPAAEALGQRLRIQVHHQPRVQVEAKSLSGGGGGGSVARRRLGPIVHRLRRRRLRRVAAGRHQIAPHEVARHFVHGRSGGHPVARRPPRCLLGRLVLAVPLARQRHSFPHALHRALTNTQPANGERQSTQRAERCCLPCRLVRTKTLDSVGLLPATVDQLVGREREARSPRRPRCLAFSFFQGAAFWPSTSLEILAKRGTGEALTLLHKSNLNIIVLNDFF